MNNIYIKDSNVYIGCKNEYQEVGTPIIQNQQEDHGVPTRIEYSPTFVGVLSGLGIGFVSYMGAISFGVGTLGAVFISGISVFVVIASTQKAKEIPIHRETGDAINYNLSDISSTGEIIPRAGFEGNVTQEQFKALASDLNKKIEEIRNQAALSQAQQQELLGYQQTFQALRDAYNKRNDNYIDTEIDYKRIK